MTYFNFKKALTSLGQNIKKLFQNGISTSLIGKVSPKDLKITCNHLYQKQDELLDDDYWYQMWKDNRSEDDDEPHTRELNY